MVNSERRRFLKYALGGSVGGVLAAGLSGADSDTEERSEEDSDPELESMSTADAETAEDSVTVRECLGRREITRGEEELECRSARENRDNITEGRR